MFDTAIVAFTTYFATIGPIEIAAIFAGLTPDNTVSQRRSMALKGVLIAGGILLVFALVGEVVLEGLGITLAAFRAAGGILLLILGIEMVFARSSGGTSTTEDEASEAAQKQDISVFPLATPLIAGPGSIAATLLLVAETGGDWGLQSVVIAALVAILVLTYLLLLSASRVQKLLGVTGLKVINRVLGILLTALAVQFIFDGVRESGIF